MKCTCGDQIADYVFQHTLLPLHGPAPQALPSLNPEAQIQLAIQHESDRGINYQIGDFLELLAAAMARLDGHHSGPAPVQG